MKTNIIRLKDCKNSKRYANWCWQTSAINTNVKYFDAAAGLGNSVGLGITMTVPLYSALTLIDKSNTIFKRQP